jgi:WD40 repeat protein
MRCHPFTALIWPTLLVASACDTGVGWVGRDAAIATPLHGVDDAAWFAGSQYIAICGDQDNMLCVLDARARRVTFSIPVSGPRRVTFGDGWWEVICGTKHGLVKAWDTMSGILRFESSYSQDEVTALDFSRRAGLTISGNRAGIIAVWDSQGALVRHWDMRETVTALAADPSGEFVVGGGANGALRVWDLRSGDERAAKRLSGGEVIDISLSPDSRTMLTASPDGAVRFWDVDPLSERWLCKGAGGYFCSVLILPDGRHGIYGDSSWLRLLDLARGEVIGGTYYLGESNCAMGLSASDSQLLVNLGTHAMRCLWLALPGPETEHE